MNGSQSPGEFAVVVLAAGASSRLGRSKQLLPYQGHTLVEHAAQVALDSGAAEVFVVLGCDADAVGEPLKDMGVRALFNPNWQEGMGSSIRTGVAALSKTTKVVVISLVDQPHVTADHLLALAEQTFKHPIAASSYDGTLGAPCAFARSQFAQLLSLEGDYGARALIRTGSDVAAVEFKAARFDIDREQDYTDFLAESK